MSAPVSLIQSSARFALPFLYPAQAQKEFIVNQATCAIDFLLHPQVVGEASTPPSAPLAGQAWIVGPNPTAEWLGQEARIAGWQAGSWHFLSPVAGMRVFDISAGQMVVFKHSWLRMVPPGQVSGGAVQDTELRLAFTNLIESLREAGIFPGH